jgi:hypothetical protein
MSEKSENFCSGTHSPSGTPVINEGCGYEKFYKQVAKPTKGDKKGGVNLE